MRILLVDHSRVTQTFWREKLEARGYTVLCVDSAEEALETLSRRRVELLLVALTLPGLDGLAFTRVLRRRPQHQVTPVILLSGSGDPVVEEEALAAGASAVVDKTNVDALWDTVDRAIEEYSLDLTGRVLYLEDSPTAAHIMLESFSKLELTVDHVRTGRDALVALQRRRYDLVVADESLEGDITGSQVVEAIRAFPDDRALLPVLGVSGAHEAEERRALFRAGITDFLGKPALPEETIARVTSLLSSHQLALAVRAERRRVSRANILDPLSGMLSRQAFLRLADKYLSQARRHNFPLALGLVSAERLGRVNDEEGYAAGDQVITAVGRRIEHSFRAGDLAGRYGGATFVVLLDHCDADAAATRFSQLIENLARIQNLPSGLRFVVGYAAVGEAEEPPLATLLQVIESAREEARQGPEPVKRTAVGWT